MQHQTVAAELHALAVQHSYRQVTLAGEHDLDGFEAKADDCHGNAAKWVLLHPQHRIVRGFLQISDYLFNKHSVVDTGLLFLDITPRPRNESRALLSFIEFDGGGPAVFDRLPPQLHWPGNS
jgi:hypothetical protein